MIQAKELFDAGQFAAAIAALQDGLKQYPSYSGARVLLGEIYWTIGEIKLAQTELEQVIQTVPDNFAAHRRLAMIYRQAGDLAAAIRSCEAVLRVNPTDQEMRALLEQISPSSARPAPSTPPEGRHGASEGVRPTPSNTNKADRTAALTPESLPDHDRPSSTRPESIDTETLAELYILQGHREQGLEIYRRLAAKNPGNRRLRERIESLEPNTVAAEEKPAQPAVVSPSERPDQNADRQRRKNKVRRLEGWLQVIRDRRRQ